jgi:hypothetical protein
MSHWDEDVRYGLKSAGRSLVDQPFDLQTS